MLENIVRSKNLSEKNKMGYKNLKFFVNNSQNRLKRVKSGDRLFGIIEDQVEQNSGVSFILF